MKCPKCKKEKDGKEFYKNKKQRSGLDGWCKECRAKDSRERMVHNLAAAFTIYGGKCQKCGESNWKVLTFRHGMSRQLSSLAGDITAVKCKQDNIELLCKNCYILADEKNSRKVMAFKYSKTAKFKEWCEMFLGGKEEKEEDDNYIERALQIAREKSAREDHEYIPDGIPDYDY